MSVPLGHKNHRSVRGCTPRVYNSKPGYIYELELVNNPILGNVYQLPVGPEKLHQPTSLTSDAFGAFYGTNTLKMIDLDSTNLDFSEESHFLSHVTIRIPKGTLDYYREKLKDFICKN